MYVMASSKASAVRRRRNDEVCSDPEISLPKQTTVEKIGGIFCHKCGEIIGNKKKYDSHYTGHDTSCTEIIYTCVLCKKQITSYPSFRNHCYLIHVVKNKFQCKHCSKKFTKQCLLSSHVSAVHEYECTYCKNIFTSKRDLDTHTKIVHVGKTDLCDSRMLEKPPYDCLLCGTVIEMVDTCEDHIDNHCKILYPCPICKEILPNKVSAVKHLSIHFDGSTPSNITTEPSTCEDSSIDILGGIRCIHCDLLFRNRAEIDIHFKSEHKELPIVYMCNACKKLYEKYDLFGKHCYDHFAKYKFECDHCDKAFVRLSLLVIHTEAFHTDCMPDKPYGCDQCGHGFMTSFRLREHLRIVHKEAEGSRSRCMKLGCFAIFDKPRDLIQHLKDHNPNLENWCKQCGLQFTSFSSAEKHLEVHRHKQYSCPICKKVYGEKYHIVKHVPVHFEAVLHICKTCGKVYSARNRLIQHMKTHSETRTYKCTHCSKSFSKPHQLQQHLNTHTGRKPYTCTLCTRTFTNYPNWSKHLKRVHLADRATIKQMNEEQKEDSLEVPRSEKSSPQKAESGIESAGSELSDIYTFMDSDDSADAFTEGYPVSSKTSIAESVKAAIDRIDFLDENIDWPDIKIKDPNFTDQCENTSEFTADNVADDASDIQAIVEHIDVLSRAMETAGHATSKDNASELEDSAPEILQYADMMPVDNCAFDPMSAPALGALYGCPEYGPDATSSLAALDDPLPHIDPRLTVQPGPDPRLYADQLAWPPPLVSKVSTYGGNSDVNNMYIC